MAARQALLDMVERIPDEDIPVVRSMLASFVPGVSILELKAIADAGKPDPEPPSEGERQGFAEAEEYLAGRANVVTHEEAMRHGRK